MINFPTIKVVSSEQFSIGDYFDPQVGDIIMDATANELKCWNGSTWVSVAVDLSDEKPSLSRTARMFIENNINLIENKDYDTLYSHIPTPALAQEVTRALLKADLNPKPYLSNIPNSIRHILEPEDVWELDRTMFYTKEEVDAMIEESVKKVLLSRR